MPKQKTHKSLSKRVAVTKTGKLLHKRSFGNHFLQKKSGSRKRRIAGMAVISGAQAKKVKRRLGF